MFCGGGHLGFSISIKNRYRNMFFSEAIALIEPKLCINDWKVLYNGRSFTNFVFFMLIGIPR
jgi:hypothetical protein